MFRSTNPDFTGDDGFTLIEALAALAIAAAGLAAIAALTHQSFRAGLAAERRLALISTARMIVAGLPARTGPPDGETSGVVDNHLWRLDSSLLTSLLTPAGGTVWRPQRIALHVQGPYGDVVEIDAIRLRKRTGP